MIHEPKGSAEFSTFAKSVVIAILSVLGLLILGFLLVCVFRRLTTQRDATDETDSEEPATKKESATKNMAIKQTETVIADSKSPVHYSSKTDSSSAAAIDKEPRSSPNKENSTMLLLSEPKSIEKSGHFNYDAALTENEDEDVDPK